MNMIVKILGISLVAVAAAYVLIPQFRQAINTQIIRFTVDPNNLPSGYLTYTQ